MALIDEIELKSKEIITDSYSMSVGEVISMYNDGDLDIHPEFQRFFRWSLSQKSRLVESFLLNPSLTFAYPFFLLSSTLRFSFAALCTTNFSRF